MPWIVIVFIIIIVISNLAKAGQQQKNEQERRRRAAELAQAADDDAPRQPEQTERMHPAPITTMKAPPAPTITGAGGRPSAQGGAPRVFTAGREGMRPSPKRELKTTITHVVRPGSESGRRHEESSMQGFTKCGPDPAEFIQTPRQAVQPGLLDELRLDSGTAAKAVLYAEILGLPKAKRRGLR